MSPTRSLLFLILTFLVVGMFQTISATPTAREIRMTMFSSQDDSNTTVEEEWTNDNLTSGEYSNETYASGENTNNVTFSSIDHENDNQVDQSSSETQANDDGHTITKRRLTFANSKMLYAGVNPEVKSGGKINGRGKGKGKSKGKINIDDDSRDTGVISVAKKNSTEKNSVATVARDRDDEVKEKSNDTYASGDYDSKVDQSETQANDSGHTITKRRAIKSNGKGNGKIYYSGGHPKVTGGGKLNGRGKGKGNGKGKIHSLNDSRETGVIYVAKISTEKSSSATAAPDRADDVKEKRKRKPSQKDNVRASSYEDTEDDDYKNPRRTNEEKTGNRREKVSRRTNREDESEDISEESENNKRRLTHESKSSTRKEKNSRRTNREEDSEDDESTRGNGKERGRQKKHRRDDVEDSAEDSY